MNEPIATVLLMVATLSLSLWAFENEQIEWKYSFRPESVLADKEYYRLVTAAFLHAGWAHLLLNLYTLYQFGTAVEVLFGPSQFLPIYFGSVIGGNLLSLYVHRHHEYAAYGASGGVCGVIFAYILRFPDQPMSLFPFPYLAPAWVFAIAFVIASFYAMKAGNDQIGHDAHLGGAMIGLTITALLRPELIQRHWAVFTVLMVACVLILSYLLGNPLFLPLTAFRSTHSSLSRQRQNALNTSAQPRPGCRIPDARAAAQVKRAPDRDWLFEQIEAQVGPLRRDGTGTHDWIDRFGRTYRVVEGEPESFDLASFRERILTLLSDPSVQFVILDTRKLRDSQLSCVRPFIADLPENQFNRVLRSYAFTPPREERA